MDGGQQSLKAEITVRFIKVPLIRDMSSKQKFERKKGANVEAKTDQN